ncbi:Collagen alpha-4(VI) chain [Actinoplanes sp. SE50]|uniref:FtsX-like permease family protein n=1 Tax=unclassified Actinoplanes TaxID=2626549 RepID=UPI00023ED5AF|nr:Collagen alpha-4(VI) chain [Actinoplanes sp. SE50/110]ATO81775.1 Collagen alpha-4(VI) chain [Actinoplanes sp. SE50]SLL99183.1 Collagen alpha-4(VI) chain [Actinoplanes sp. SE50/110]
MPTILWGAVRSRAAQACTLLLLTGLPAAVAAAAPRFVLTGTERAATAAAAGVPAAQRTITVHREDDTQGDPAATLAGFGAAVDRTLPMPGAATVLGLSRQMSVTDASGVPTPINVDYRAGFCRRVRLTAGTCPAAAGDAALTTAVATRLGVRPGDLVRIQSTSAAPFLPLRVTGIYEIIAPETGYWADELYRTGSGTDPIYTAAATFTGDQLGRAVLTWSAEAPPALLRGAGGYDLGALVARAGELGDVEDPTGPLRADLADAGARLLRAVLLAAVPVLLLGWYAIALAGRYTARDRRRDAAWAKLRGGRRRRVLLLLSGQHLPPVLAGGLLGATVGIGVARLLDGAAPPVTAAGSPGASGVDAGSWGSPDVVAGSSGSPGVVAWSLGAAGLVVGGALATLVIADLLLLRTPVGTLQRDIPAARGGRAALLADALLVAVAVAAAYQARSGSPDAGVGAVAPLAVAAAVAVLLARLLIRAADAGGAAALRAGRLRAGLAAVRMSRLAGLDRVFAILAVAVAILVTAAGAAGADRRAHRERAEAELGAARVLTVRVPNWTVLWHAVRAADPAGRYAMAAAVDRTGSPPTVAVDFGRLGVVGAWRPEYGPRPAPPESPVPSVLPNSPDTPASPGPATSTGTSTSPGAATSSGTSTSPGAAASRGTSTPPGTLGSKGTSVAPVSPTSAGTAAPRGTHASAGAKASADTPASTATGAPAGSVSSLGTKAPLNTDASPGTPAASAAFVPTGGSAPQGPQVSSAPSRSGVPVVSVGAGPGVTDGAPGTAVISGRSLVLKVRNGRTAAATVDAVLLNETSGARVVVSFGPVPPGEHAVTRPLDGCDGGCRLLRWEIPSLPGADGKPTPDPVVLHSLARLGPDAELIGPARMADATRWRTVAAGVGLQLSGGPDGLTVTAAPNGGTADSDRVFAVDSLLPLPVLLAGPTPVPWRFAEPEITVLGAGPVPARVTGTAAALPVTGAAGILLDFDTVRRTAGEFSPAGETQVWLTANAPPDVVDRLRAAGVTVLGDESIAGRAARRPGRGTAPAGPFALLCAVSAVFTAAGATAVAAAVDRVPQRAATAALRVQGLPARAAAATRYLGPSALVAAGTLGGVAAALVARWITGEPESFFADGWRLLPPPEVLGGAPLLLAAFAAWLFLTLLAALAARTEGDHR